MADEKKSVLKNIITEVGLSPEAVMTEVKQKKGKLFIGIPKETLFQEKRVALTPESVATLVANGNKVVIESNAGKNSFFHDTDYSEAGAEMTHNTEQVYQADIIVKVAPPTDAEINMMKLHQIIISPIHLPTLKREYIEKLMFKKVTAIAFEYIKDDAHSYPIVRAMSEIAGSTALLLASEYLSNTGKGKGVLLGGITGVPPAKVVIIGAGVVGEFASRTALGLGAEIYVFDNNIYKLIRLQNNIGRRVFTSVINPEILMRELQEADVAVGAIHSGEGRTPVIVTDEMVSKMKAGSVILDVSIDQGGIFETSHVTNHDDPVFKKYDVIHYCVPNIASRVSRTASSALSSILATIIQRAGDMGGIERLMIYDEDARHGSYIYKGHLTNKHLAERFSMKYTDLNLVFTAGM